MDRDRQMSETLGDNTELGDSARLIMISLPGLPYHANEMCWSQWNVPDACLDQETMSDQNLRMVAN